ncbi:hypothetical protein PYW08_002640 [Mythimna loreyi]|uniref:Uncharacterized protein n=1 Tax=Mythimna loreyi TaxID=667449 RepID=A0ACC2QL54_9NEOP|nr:hypothetical protein PYW08_002640 [Mythimna loreyi]
MASNSSSQNMKPSPDNSDVKELNKDERIIVIFHLDTNLRNQKLDEICQIAAQCGEKEFQVYMLPENSFNYNASAANGFGIVQNGTKKQLIHDKKVVNAVSEEDGLKKFLEFLRDQTSNNCTALLAAYNCLTYHRYVLIRLLIKYNLLNNFESLVLGFIDTMKIFKEMLPIEEIETEGSSKKTYELKDLAKQFLNYPIPDTIHAKINVEISVSLIEKYKYDIVLMKKHADDLKEFIRYYDLRSTFGVIKKDNKRDAAFEGYLRKMAKAGITVDKVENAYKQDPTNGIPNLLKDPLLSFTPKAIQKINDIVKVCLDNRPPTTRPTSLVVSEPICYAGGRGFDSHPAQMSL